MPYLSYQLLLLTHHWSSVDLLNWTKLSTWGLEIWSLAMGLDWLLPSFTRSSVFPPSATCYLACRTGWVKSCLISHCNWGKFYVFFFPLIALQCKQNLLSMTLTKLKDAIVCFYIGSQELHRMDQHSNHCVVSEWYSKY